MKKRNKPLEITKKIILELVPIALIMIFVFLFYLNNLILTLLILAVIIVSLLVNFQKHEVWIMIIGTPIIMIIEYLLVRSGAESFSNPVVFGLPIWLPFIWAYGLVVMKRIAMFLSKL